MPKNNLSKLLKLWYWVCNFMSTMEFERSAHTFMSHGMHKNNGNAAKYHSKPKFFLHSLFV